MKAFVGALLGAGLMYAVRRWLTMPLPFVLGPLSGANLSLGEAAMSTGTIGGMAITSLAAIAGLLGGFYEADNDPSEGSSTPEASGKRAPATNKRIAADEAGDEADDEAAAEADPKRSKK